MAAWKSVDMMSPWKWRNTMYTISHGQMDDLKQQAQNSYHGPVEEDNYYMKIVTMVTWSNGDTRNRYVKLATWQVLQA